MNMGYGVVFGGNLGVGDGKINVFGIIGSNIKNFVGRSIN